MKNTVLTILGILFVAGMGVGGYFLGRYLDQSAVDKAYQAELAKPVTMITYKSEAYGFELQYPSNWIIEEAKADDTEFAKNIKGITLTSKKTSSQFEYVQGTFDTKWNNLYARVCDSEDPTGKVKTNSSCTFVQGTNETFGRTKIDDLSGTENGDFWAIAKKSDATSGKLYYFDYNNHFGYFVRDASDLTILDTILKSIKLYDVKVTETK